MMNKKIFFMSKDLDGSLIVNENNWDNGLMEGHVFEYTFKNGLFALQDSNKKIVSLALNKEDLFKQVDIDFNDVYLFTNYPVEIFNEYLYYKYGYSDEDRFVPISIDDAIVEFEKIQHSIKNIFQSILDILKKYPVSPTIQEDFVFKILSFRDKDTYFSLNSFNGLMNFIFEYRVVFKQQKDIHTKLIDLINFDIPSKYGDTFEWSNNVQKLLFSKIS